MSTEPEAKKRNAMIETQLIARSIRDAAVLAAMHAVSREAFVPPEWVEEAYDDRPLPIDQGQTISQPYMVALMAQALLLTPHDRVLEIGTGTGYSAAVLSQIAAEVYTVERLESLATSARERLRRLGFHNICVHNSDGTLGWPQYAPYHGIVVTAGGPSIPAALREQLAIGGRLVMPVGTSLHCQRLIRLTRQSPTQMDQEELVGVRFVPLIGAQGWSDVEAREQEPETGSQDSEP
jgi:protein-L-isoaspartate(D-aspartate) O-methyltransferase